MVGKKMVAVLTAGLIALALNPAAAFADSLSAGEVASQAAQVEVQPKAKTQTVYVLTKIKDVNNAKSKDGYSGDPISYTESAVVTFGYAGNGLLSKSNYKRTYKREGMNPQKQSAQRQWSYNKKNQLVKVKRNYGTAKLTLKNGKMTKAVTDYSYMKDTRTFVYKSGKVSSMKSVQKGSYSQTGKEAYRYSGGKIVSIKKGSTNANEGTYTTTLNYDKKGNLTGRGPSGNEFALTYGGKNKSLLTKRYCNTYKEETQVGGKRTITYSYKPVKVNAKLAAKVKAQQWALLNDNMNFALGPWHGEGFMNAANNFN